MVFLPPSVPFFSPFFRSVLFYSWFEATRTCVHLEAAFNRLVQSFTRRTFHFSVELFGSSMGHFSCRFSCLFCWLSSHWLQSDHSIIQSDFYVGCSSSASIASRPNAASIPPTSSDVHKKKKNCVDWFIYSVNVDILRRKLAGFSFSLELIFSTENGRWRCGAIKDAATSKWPFDFYRLPSRVIDIYSFKSVIWNSVRYWIFKPATDR